MNIQDKRVLLTGANGGIGAAIAHELKQHGAELVLSGRKAEPLAALASAIGGARYVVADMGNEHDVQRLLDEAGTIDILVANVGLPGTGELNDWSTAEIDACLDVNLRAPILLARGLVPGMVERGAGQLVFISSIAGKVASPLSSLYSASKFGLRGFADCLRMDLHGSGVGVSTVYPGMISDAGMYANSGASVPRGAPTNTAEDVAHAVRRAITDNRASTDVAGLALKLGVHIGHFSPSLNGVLQRLVGARQAAQQFADGHRRKTGG